MKKKIALFLTIILLFSLAGCRSSSNTMMDNGAGIKGVATSAGIGWDGVMSNSASPSFAGDYMGDRIEVASEMPAPTPDAPYGRGEVLANSKIIYSANLDLETKEFDASIQSLSALVKEMDGYFEYKNANNGYSYRSMDCKIRIPVKNFTSFLDKIGETAHVTRRSENLDDISETYYDQEARLTTQRTKLDRLHELLSQAENMEDIITLESAISDTELQIEYLTGSLRKYDSLVDFSTINVYLQEVYRLSSDESIPETFGERFSDAISLGFRRGVEGVEDFTIEVAQNWMSILLFVCVLTPAAILIRKKVKRAASRHQFRPKKKIQAQNIPENNQNK